MARRRQRRRKKKSSAGGGLGTGGVFVAAVPLMLVAFFLANTLGQRYGLLGSLIWLGALSLSFGMVCVALSRYLLPLEGDMGWYEGARLLLVYFVSHLPAILGEPLRDLLNLKKYPPSPDGVPSSFSSLGAGFVESHLALALAKGNAFSRAVGPGYVHLRSGERIRHVFDLREHRRERPVKILTRDGIPVDTSIAVVFYIRTQVDGEVDEDAIFRISYAVTRGEDLDEVAWTERVPKLAAASLVTILSEKTLDELYPANTARFPQLEEVVERVREDLDERLRSIYGYREPGEAPIIISQIAVGQLIAPEDVVEQRIRNWQLNWQRLIDEEKASGGAEALRRLNRARARAQLDLLESIVTNIEVMHDSGHTDLSEIVRLRMLEALETAASDNQVKALIPQHVMAALDRIQSIMSRPTQADAAEST